MMAVSTSAPHHLESPETDLACDSIEIIGILPLPRLVTGEASPGLPKVPNVRTTCISDAVMVDLSINIL